MNDVQDFRDDEVYPVAFSAGGINAFTHGCKLAGQRLSYCVCVAKIEAFQRDRQLPPGMSCNNEIRDGDCPAIRMRREEVEKGHAIYFINRKKMQDHFQIKRDEAAKAAREAAALNKQPKRSSGFGKLVTVPAAPEAPKHFLDIKTGSYADALNAATAAPEPTPEPVTPALKPTPQPAPVVAAPKPPQASTAAAAPIKAGMSIIEMARLQLAAKQSQLGA